MSDRDCLKHFHPLVREWFLSKYGAPTPVQAATWRRVAAGEHVLAVAPTGSGKTLAAFLGAISRLASGELPAGSCSVVYVSPLKALGEDVRRNLEAPLAELAALFAARGVPFPRIGVATRTGDTGQSERRRMLSRPPAMLVTTPESLAIMLDAASSRRMLAGARLLVLDEVHAVAGNKRGALLACSVGRLALLAGEFQRVALSATVGSPDTVASFVGGLTLERGSDGSPTYRPRRVEVVDPAAEKRIELVVEWPEAPVAPRGDRGGRDADRYEAVVPALCSRMDSTRGILVFTDSRRRAERLAFLINEERGEIAAWSHHGSLSKEVRRAVEARFKEGGLACVVATASLELGIDVGSVEEVELAGAPGTVSAALQRVGRSGHGVGEASRGRIFPFHGLDLLISAAVVRGVAERAVEDSRPVSCPLDVLAQALLELALEPGIDGGQAPRTVDELYDIVRSFPPFATLPRSLFDSTVEMLAGRYAGSRVRELEPRIVLDRATGAVSARDGVRQLLYSSGGTIPDRGLYSLRLSGPRTKIGELDEEFVWERRVGESFALGSQVWKIVEIGDEAVEVVPAPPDPDIVPFWKGEARFRSPGICDRVLDLLDRMDDLDEAGGAALLRREYGFDEGASRACSRFVAAQKAAGLGKPSLPRSGRVVLELCEDGTRRADSIRLVLHTLRGLAINDVLGMGLAAAWEEELGLPIQYFADDDSVILAAPRTNAAAGAAADASGTIARILGDLGDSRELERLVRGRLEGSGLFGAQFRENAGRSLLLPRGLPGKRIPLWVSRLRAKRLFEAVRRYDDFPIIVETWRSCLRDLLDLEGAAELARGVASGAVELSCFATRVPSPLARESVWREIGENIYRTDELDSRPASSVSDRVIAEALRSARARPRLSGEIVRDYERRLKRLLPGWGPESVPDFAEWVRERAVLPVSELPELLAASAAAVAADLERDSSCGGRVARLALPGAAEEVLVHVERRRELESDPAGFVAEWLRREACVSLGRITSLFGLRPSAAADLVDGLEEEGVVAADVLVGDSEEPLVADVRNLEVMLRRGRRAARPAVEARPRRELFGLVAAVQGLKSASGAEEVGAPLDGRRVLGPLEGYPLPLAILETEILPARAGAAWAGSSRLLDDLADAGAWQWFGTGREAVALAQPENLELFLDRKGCAGARGSRLLPEGAESLDFWAIKNRAGLTARDTALALWAEAWDGLVAADSFAPLREGIANRFGRELPETAGPSAREPVPFGSRRRLPRALRERWRMGAPVGGRWFRLDLEEGEPRDSLDEEDLDAARARILVARYGIVCRGLLERELPPLRWGRIFTALRRLELAGELLSGRFFDGLEGPQFMGREAFRLFSDPGTWGDAGAAWLNALDPAATALDFEGWGPGPVQRVATSRVCALRGQAVAAATRSFRELTLTLDPEDPLLPQALSIFAGARPASAPRRLVLETVNGIPAARCPYVDALRKAGFETERGRMALWGPIAP